jgi:hypothetical protein
VQVYLERQDAQQRAEENGQEEHPEAGSEEEPANRKADVEEGDEVVERERRCGYAYTIS